MILLFSCVAPSQEFIWQDKHNYSLVSSLESTSIAIAEGQDASIDWSSVTRDLLGNPVSAEAIDKVSIIRFHHLSPEEILTGINQDTLRQADVSGFVDFFPVDQMQANITDFSLQGTYVEPATDLLSSQGTFLAVLNKYEDVVSLLFIRPESSSENRSVIVADDSVTLAVDVNLDGEQMPIEAAREYYFDWSNLTQTGQGSSFYFPQVDRLMLAGFSTALPALEEDFLQLEQLADVLYRHDVTGLTTLPVKRIEGFSSFAEAQYWVLALQCSRCMNPAPHFVGALE